MPWPRRSRSGSRSSSGTPVVFIAGTDPVAGGLVRSLREPGGNATGVFQMVADALGKRLELAHEVFPQSRRIGVLFDVDAADYALQKREHAAIALPKGVSLAAVEIRSVDKLREALSGMTKEGASAFLTVPSFPALAHRKELVGAALEIGLAPIGHRTEFADSGALFSFGADAFDLQRRAADLASRVLRGARPATTPVERATKFELVFNLRTARKLGIQVPKNVLLRADRTIE
jgi:putative ABC transport system substrate-binding protein